MPIVLPKPSDPRLHLAAVIVSLQILGQAAFHFRVSIAQILLSIATCAVLEIAITARKQKVWMWPASALLTGNGVAFILRVPGTPHGAWWSLHGWWIFVATAAVSLLSKYVITWRGGHIFNPSNIGLVLCFLVLGKTRAEPLDFWWGPMSWWLGLALVIIVAGGFLILTRLKLLVVAVGFWVSFAAGIAVLCATGHSMTARWHLGPIAGFHFWQVLLTSPEVLVFLFYMITDPKTAPAGRRPRLVYAVAIGLLAAVLIAPMQTEYASKVALLGALAIVCLARPLLDLRPLRVPARPALGLVVAAAYALVLFAAGIPARAPAAQASVLPSNVIPPIAIATSRGVDQQLRMPAARAIASALVKIVPARTDEKLTVWLERGRGQSGPTAVASLGGRTYRLALGQVGWTLLRNASAKPPVVRALHGYVLAPIWLPFRQGSFRYGTSGGDTTAMMGGGVCWLDANGDGRLDLFAVNGYDDPHFASYKRVPQSTLYLNMGGNKFVPSFGIRVKGEGCVAGDLDGDGRPDLVITTATDDVLLWNEGDGRFREAPASSGFHSFMWHAGAAIADVNGDGRPDLYLAGYTNINAPIESSLRGFPRNYLGVRDELFLNLGHRRFRDVGVQAGLDAAPYDHSLGAEFMDANHDGRMDLFVANDEDPNRLYVNEPGGPLGFHFVERATEYGVADANAGMGIAAHGGYLFVSNSRGQTHAVYRRGRDVRKSFAAAFGTNLTGWGDSWIDLRNDGSPNLVLANGAIPVTSLKRDAAQPEVLASRHGRWIDAGLLQGLTMNGRGLAAADYDNDGRVDIAVGSIGGKLLLLHNKSPGGHWLTVAVKPFSPGAQVIVLDSHGRAQEDVITAGSSYLSSEDPRAHFGFGSARPVRVTVRYPNGTVRTAKPRTNSLLTVVR
jgi:Na+-translocating ferredoxin:NAD+ oxidoreductase RnfD subunit